MSKKRNGRRQTARAEPMQTRSIIGLWDGGTDGDLACQGYTSLSQNPEIVTAVDTIARLIGSMTIHLMQNTADGDVRIVNELSRRVDISPSNIMTRSNLMAWIVKTLFLDGGGNAVVLPRTDGGYLRELIPIPPALVSFLPAGPGYQIVINGYQFDPSSVLHFVINPGSYYPWLGEGYRVALSDVAGNLRQAAATEKGFMASKWKPSLIIKVDALAREFAGQKGRAKLLEEYVETGGAGQPWIIPAEQFEVQQVKPLTLSDLALADFVKLDKQTVATILGVPPFVLGVGEFNRDAWNTFISSRIMPLAQVIQQELTKKLLYSPDYYFRFNSRSLYNYDLSELAQIADDQFVRGIMTGNEVRDWLGLSPKPGLNDLVILENYIPRGMIGDQKKLNQTGGENE